MEPRPSTAPYLCRQKSEGCHDVKDVGQRICGKDCADDAFASLAESDATQNDAGNRCHSNVSSNFYRPHADVARKQYATKTRKPGSHDVGNKQCLCNRNARQARRSRVRTYDPNVSAVDAFAQINLQHKGQSNPDNGRHRDDAEFSDTQPFDQSPADPGGLPLLR